MSKDKKKPLHKKKQPKNADKKKGGKKLKPSQKPNKKKGEKKLKPSEELTPEQLQDLKSHKGGV